MFDILILVTAISLLFTFYLILLPAFILCMLARFMNFYDRDYGTAFSVMIAYVVITIVIEFVYSFLAVFISNILSPISSTFSLIFIAIIAISIPIIVLTGMLMDRYDANQNGAILASTIITLIEVLFVYIITPIIVGGNYNPLQLGDPNTLASILR